MDGAVKVFRIGECFGWEDLLLAILEERMTTGFLETRKVVLDNIRMDTGVSKVIVMLCKKDSPWGACMGIVRYLKLLMYRFGVA